jgi:serine/threonine protein kinase
MLNPGDVLENKYRIDQALSKGAFGRVWKAYDTILDREVAIKELLEVKQEQLESFVKEMQTLAKLDCEKVIKINQAIPSENNFFLVMEYCPFGSLWNYLKVEGKLPIEKAVEYAIEICTGLSIIHKNKIVHHDIKPSNILLGNDGHIKISDFGVANTRLGTIHYLASDQFYNGANPKDPRTDIYALGITLYEMLTGEVPYKGDEAQIMNGHIYEQPSFPAFVPDWMCNIIVKAIAKQPDLRFQTAEEFRKALETKKAPSILKPEMLTASMWNSEAEKLMKKRQWRKAMTYLEESLRLYPDYSFAHAHIGVCYQHLGLLDKALHHLNEGKYHLTPLVVKSLSAINIDSQEYGKAISMLSEYTYKNPLDYEAHNLLGKAFFEVGYYDKAIELYDALLTKNRANTVFTNNLMLSYFISGMDENIKSLLKSRYTNDNGFKYFKYNWDVLYETSLSWNSRYRETAKPKMLFAPYHEHIRKRIVHKDKNCYAKLEVLSDKRSYNSSEQIISIGRLNSNLFVLNEMNVSRRHCVLVRDEDQWILIDLGSTVGTYVNDKKVSKIFLLLGVENITIGTTKCKLILG